MLSVTEAAAIDPVSLIAFEKILVTVSALKKLEETLRMNRERIFKVLVAPHISEKATILADKNDQYVFRIAPRRN